MKITSAIFFGILSFLILFTSPALAQYNGLSIPTQSITPSPSPTPVTVNYNLPYPGILPGSPLYGLKAFRDKLMEFLVSDPAKRSNFYLLQADKRFASSLDLFKSGQGELAETTLSKSQNYLEKSLNEASRARTQQENVNDVLARTKTSAQFQIQEIKLIIPNQKGDTAIRLQQDLKRAVDLRNRAEQLNP